jgi:oligoendopeptidase F
MSPELPESAQVFMDWPWAQIEPHYQALIERPISATNVDAWLADWTKLTNRVQESLTRLQVATAVDTTDQVADRRYQVFLDQIYPPSRQMEQKLKEKLLASGLEPSGFEIPLRNLRAEASLYRQENLPLISEEMKLGIEYDKVIGAQTVEWEGQELTISQLKPISQEIDRSRREQAWRLSMQRQLADREALNDLWGRFLQLRTQIAANADLPDYREYMWRNWLRFDYTPADCEHFHNAIEKVVVPAARQIYEKRRQTLGIATLRPWDLDVDVQGRSPLRPFSSVEQLEEGVEAIFNQVNPRLGEYFVTMRTEKLLDLDNRKGKAPGGFCTEFNVQHRPFIFMNAVGIHDDVQTLLHEGGHAFHVFETRNLPYYQQLQVGMEFAEVASMAMELLAAPYLEKDRGGFYTSQEAARARIEHLEGVILFWPYMAVVDGFQHWVYQHPQEAMIAANCDATWSSLWDRFMQGVDWSGLDQEKATGWHRKLHIFQVPFYYVEYGLAQLGSIQVWRNAISDQAQAVNDYRKALALGATVPLPMLYATAGAKFAFDEQTLGEAVDLAMKTIAELEQIQEG